MNLSFLGIGNSGQNQTEQIKTPVSEETAPKQLPASSANLKSGQVISGEVFAMDGRDIQLLLDNHQVLTARLEQQLPMSVGQLLSFEVKAFQQGQISLRPLYANLAQNPALLAALEEAGLPVNETTAEMVHSLMKEGMPIDRSSLHGVYKLIMENPQAGAKAIVQMLSADLPVTKESIAQFENYMNQNHQIQNQVDSLAGEFPKLLLDLMNEEGIGKAMEVNREILDIFSENAQEEVLSFKEEGESLIKPEENGQKAERLLLEENPFNKGERKEGIEGKQADVPLTKAEGEKLAGQLRNLGLSKEAASQIQNLELSIKEILNIVKELSEKGHENIPEKAWKALLQGKEYQTLLRMGVEKEWLLNPKEIAQKGKIEEFYEKLNEQTSKVSRLLESLGKTEGHLMKGTETLRQNVNFLNQVNQMYAYVQLPLKMSTQNAHGDLYVYANKKNLASKEGNVSALLHLEMDHLGTMDIHVALKSGTKVNTHFYLEKEEIIDFVEKNIYKLNERLEKRGYSMETQVSTKEKEGGFLTNLLNKEKSSTIVQQYSFDVRA